MKKKKTLFNDLQYNNNFLIKRIIFIMICAFILQVAVIHTIGNNSSLLILDYFILNDLFSSMFTSIIIWIIPFFISFICGSQFIFFSPLKEKLFNRVDRKKYIIKRAFISAFMGFIFTLLFYIFCFIFLLIIFKTINYKMEIAVTLRPSSGALLPFYYFENPFLYIGIYVLIISLFAAAFAIIGFYVSLLTSNKFFVYIIPFTLIITYSVLAGFTPKSIGTLFDYTNIASFSPITLTHFSKNLHIICGISAPIIIILIFSILIVYHSNKDYTL